MTKISDIHRGNGNIYIGGLIGLVATILIGWISLYVLQLDILSYLDQDKLLEVLMILPTVMFIFVIHEYVHVGFFLLFGKGKAKIKVVREKSVGAVVMHQVNENVFYTRIQMVIILLAPLIVVTIALLIMHIFIPASFLIWTNIVLNALGSAIDLYVSYKLLTIQSKSIIVNFKADEVVMNIYKRANP